KFYNFLLVSHPIGKIALNYLKEERKINDDSIKTFNIGFAPRNKNAFSDFLTKKKKMKVKDIEKAGIIFVSKGGHIYDRFEGRIIFPISDHRGNVVALAGRLLPPGKPNVGKYINSPQTPIYNKSASLYGLNVTKDFIKKSGFAVVVEGELDLVSSFQVGVKNIVAIKGSAFTEDQGRLLGRYTKEIVLALDSDFAGVNAALHGIKILQNLGFDIKVAKLGKFKDPDEAAKGSPEFLEKAIKEAVPIWDFIIESSLEKFDVNTISGKTKIGNFLTPFLASIENKIVQSHYAKKVANLLSVDTTAVLEEVEKNSENERKPEVKVETKKGEAKTRREVLEERFIGLILRNKPELSKSDEVKKIVETPILVRLCKEFNEDPKSLPSELFDKYAEFSLLFSNDNDAKIKNEINEIFRQLNILGVKEKMDIIVKSKESKKSKSLLTLSKELKEFNSGEFKRIIS
ncbi:MAG TPA: toprim domain-containing protein, partial [Candidatus Saccharimonadales bacterium]|nr:toprim domain-containing protein [Candidatus Saccharimonadales bacterium]